MNSDPMIRRTFCLPKKLDERIMEFIQRNTPEWERQNVSAFVACAIAHYLTQATNKVKA